MNVDALLGRLQRVRSNGERRWMACCPAHEDKSASLSIRELPDGRILLNDFAGCGTSDVLAALGLQLTDLFPERLDVHLGPARDRKHFHAAREALRCIHFECLVVAIAAESMIKGKVLSEGDVQRLVLAAQRVRHAADLVG